MLWAPALKTGAASTQSPFQNQPWGGGLLSSQRQVLCLHPNVWAFLSTPFKGPKKEGKKPNIILCKLLLAGRVTEMLYEPEKLNLDSDRCCC